MSVTGWKELAYTDEVVWDTLAKGELDGIEFGRGSEDGDPSDKEMFLSYAKRIKPRTIGELTVALALAAYHWHWVNGEIVERVLKAFEFKTLDGPFEQLRETYGYPVFRDQLVTVLSDSMGLDMDQAYELADGMSKRKTSAEEMLRSSQCMSKKDKELFWKVAPTVAGRKWHTHYANLIYEACWIVYNSAVRDYYAEHPIKIY